MTDDEKLKRARPYFTIPSPQGSLIMGNLGSFTDDFLPPLVEAIEEYGDVVRFRFIKQKAAVFRHPDDVYHILLSNHRNYLKQTRGYRAMRYLMGNGLVTSEGDFWLRQRRIAQPSFHRKRVRDFAATMVAVAQKRATIWAEAADTKEIVDVAPHMMEVALDVVGRTLLSTNLVEESSTVSENLEIVLRDVVVRTNAPIFKPLWLPGKNNRRTRDAINTLVEMVDQIIAQRRQSRDNPPDLLTMLMEARDDTGQGMSDEQLRDEVMTIFLAGHETTATALTWTWYLLARHPEYEKKLHDELDQVLDGRAATVEDLKHLEWTRMIIDESMRLYPPVPLVARMSQEDDVVGGYEIPANTFVFVGPYLTHRHPDYWPAPEVFRPERFRDRRAGRPRFAYFPFLGGPRQCIGNNFALIEAQLILATLASRYRLRLVDEEPVGMDVTITLRPEGGMPMNIETRR